MLIYLRPLTSQPVGFRLAFSITLFSVLLPALRYMSNLPRIKTLIQNVINSRVFFKVCQRMRPVKSTNCGMSTEFFTCLPCQNVTWQTCKDVVLMCEPHIKIEKASCNSAQDSRNLFLVCLFRRSHY